MTVRRWRQRVTNGHSAPTLNRKTLFFFTRFFVNRYLSWTFSICCFGFKVLHTIVKRITFSPFVCKHCSLGRIQLWNRLYEARWSLHWTSIEIDQNWNRYTICAERFWILIVSLHSNLQQNVNNCLLQFGVLNINACILFHGPTINGLIAAINYYYYISTMCVRAVRTNECHCMMCVCVFFCFF